MNLIFYGSSQISVFALEQLAKKGIIPVGIITTPSKPQGRGQILTNNIVAEYALTNNIPYIAPATLKNSDAELLVQTFIQENNGDIALVFSYGNIIPENILNIPAHNTLNIHPSLLPLYRGPSPIQSMILANEQRVGVSIMLLDALMDHGPILGQRSIDILAGEQRNSVLEHMLVSLGVELFTEVYPQWMAKKITHQEQDHTHATYTKKFEKEDKHIHFSFEGSQKMTKDEHQKAYRTFCAFDTQGAYFFDHDKRIKVIEAEYVNGVFTPTIIIPEGKKQMSAQEYIRGNKKTP